MQKYHLETLPVVSPLKLHENSIKSQLILTHVYENTVYIKRYCRVSLREREFS